MSDNPSPTGSARRRYRVAIDTGGTFTDGVLLDAASREVLQTAKVLTTHADLRICIAEILGRAGNAGGTAADAAEAMGGGRNQLVHLVRLVGRCRSG